MLMVAKTLQGNKHNRTVVSRYIRRLRRKPCNWPCFVYNARWQNSVTQWISGRGRDLSTESGKDVPRASHLRQLELTEFVIEIICILYEVDILRHGIRMLL